MIGLVLPLVITSRITREMAPSGDLTAAPEVAVLNGSLPRGQPRADGPASVMGIGTAVPPAEFLQSEYPDFFFNITNCGDKENLKAKFKRICKLFIYPHTQMLLQDLSLKSDVSP